MHCPAAQSIVQLENARAYAPQTQSHTSESSSTICGGCASRAQYACVVHAAVRWNAACMHATGSTYQIFLTPSLNGSVESGWVTIGKTRRLGKYNHLISLNFSNPTCLSLHP